MIDFCIQCKKRISSAQPLIETEQGAMHFDCFTANQSPEKPGYFPPYDDIGNRRTIKNAVDCGFSAID